MLSKNLEKAFNDQINAEMFSAYLYLSMAAYFDSLNLKGFSNWMRVQFQEEWVHAMKFFDYINERGGRVVLEKIEKPQAEWKSPLDAFEAAYKHEQMITGRINDLVDLAIKENDHAAKAFLQWFVTEQVEEEASTDEVVQMLKMVKESPNGMFMVDRELSKRTFASEASE